METLNRNRTKLIIAAIAIIFAISALPLADYYFGTKVTPMTSYQQPTAAPTAAAQPTNDPVGTPSENDHSLLKVAFDDEPITVITPTETISYELDLLRLFNYQHGDVFTGNDDISVSMETLDGDPATTIVFDTSSDQLGATDLDKHTTTFGKGLAINKSDHSIHADGGAVITFTLTTSTFVSDVQVVDLDRGAMRVVGLDEKGNEVFRQSMSPDAQLIKTMAVNTTVKTLIIRVKDSFVLLPHFRAFSSGELRAFWLPKTLGECTSTAEEAAQYPDKPSCN